MASSAPRKTPVPYLSAIAWVRSRPKRQPPELGFDVAEQFQRKTRVVFDDAINLFDGLALRPELDRAQLEAFHEDIGGRIGDRADGRTADVDPVAVDGEKTDQLIAVGTGEDRRVHDRVIKMLALDRRVIAEHNITFVEIFSAIDFQSVPHRHAHGIGDEDRHAAGALRQQFAVGADEAHGVVLVFVDVRAERRARHIGIDLIADGNDAMPDHFQSYRIDRDRFRWLVSRKLIHAKDPFETIYTPGGRMSNFVDPPVHYRPYRLP